MVATNALKIITVAFVIVVLLAGLFFFWSLAAPEKSTELEQFTVGMSDDTSDVAEKLKSGGFIKNIWAYKIAFFAQGGQFGAADDVEPGAYKISKSSNAWVVADTLLHGKPYMKWVAFPEGLRKEEMADVLAVTLGWSEEEKGKWITEYTTLKPDYVEGVYYPDTYLIPVDEPPRKVAERMQSRFQEKFAPYAAEALAQNIRWPTLLKVASIVQREAAGRSDMPLIAGILWNRLLQNIKLEVDATLQYARGNAGKGWWAPITLADKKIDSPYNTYKYKGLPPHPIANPGLDAIKAVLHSEETKCLFYLHDSSGQIHCAETYEGHKKNIEAHLR